MEKRLRLRQAENLAGFVLPDRNGLDAAAEDLGKICRVVQREGQDGGVHAIQIHAGQCRDGEIDGENLKHQRRAAHHEDIQRNRRADDLPFAHAQKRKGKTERQGENQRETEDEQRIAKTAHHGENQLHQRVEIVEIPHESLRSLGILGWEGNRAKRAPCGSPIAFPCFISCNPQRTWKPA